jgi:hypothetical protein
MSARLFIAIVALVLTLLGVVFGVLGLVLEDAEASGILGGVLLAVGLLLAGVALAIHRRLTAQARRRREGGRATGDVLEARLHQYTRIGVMLTYTATIRFAAADGAGVREYTRRILVPPTVPLEAGGRVEIAYDSSDPANFEVIGASR